MMTLFTRISPLILLALFSCSTIQEDAVIHTQPTNDNSMLLELVNSSWRLKTCPTTSAINIEGFNECSYLNYMSFTEEAIFIRHGNNSYFTKHNICFVDGGNMVVSRQGCGFTEWSGVLEWEIIHFDESSMDIEVRFPNLNPGYSERFIFESA
jgi:hypothetical protein